MHSSSRLLASLALLLLLSSACQEEDKSEAPAAPATPSATRTEETSSTGGASTVDRDALLNPASMTEKAPELFTVDFATTAGEFTVECHREWAPEGADRFYNLVKRGFFNQVRFFRVVPGFMVQFGIHGDPEVSAQWSEARIKDDPVTQSNLPGTLSFATRGPNTRTTQLFINYGNNGGLDGQGFSPFGKVLSGMDTVNGIYSVYREQPSQGSITDSGNAYLQTEFPEMDYILTTTLR